MIESKRKIKKGLREGMEVTVAEKWDYLERVIGGYLEGYCVSLLETRFWREKKELYFEVLQWELWLNSIYILQHKNEDSLESEHWGKARDSVYSYRRLNRVCATWGETIKSVGSIQDSLFWGDGWLEP